MYSPIKPVFTAHANATGGRNGHSESTDKSVSVDLATPKEMGGPDKPGTTTPEHLFAVGYAACFCGALDLVGKKRKIDASMAKVTCSVSLGPREAGGFGVAVKMRVADASIATAELKKLVDETHEQICPYSHATRGNVAIEFEVVGK